MIDRYIQRRFANVEHLLCFFLRYIHSDWVAATLRAAAPSLRKFRVAPASGFFLLHDNVANAPVYQTQMRNIFALSNSSGGVGAACAAAMVATMVGGAAAEDDTWKCMFAQYAYAHSTEATFVENSALDMWQTSCIFTAALVDGFPNQKGTNNGNCSGAAGHWGDCAGDPEKCKYVYDIVVPPRGEREHTPLSTPAS